MATAPGYLLVGAGAYSTEAATTQAGTFVDMGGFREDLRIRFSEERFNLEVADHLAFVKSVRTRLDCFINTQLVEARFKSLGVALGIAANSFMSATGSMELIIGQLAPKAHKFVGSDATNPASGELISWTFSQAVPNVDLELSFQKSGEVLVPAAFMVLGTLNGAKLGFGHVAVA